MSATLPYRIQVFRAFLTPVVAALVGVIGFFQWRTAHQKVVLDLFERRMNIYTACGNVLKNVIRNPSATTTENALEFRDTSAAAEFLFGDEVVAHLKTIEIALFDLATSEAELKDKAQSQERTDLVSDSRKAINTIGTFYDPKFRSILMEYMRLTQKNVGGWPRSPF